MKQINYKNIALSGDVGTGTTTLGKNLAATLGWEHTNAGAYFRAWHREKGIPLEQVEAIPEEVDRELDQRFKDDMSSKEHHVFESHLAGWLAKDLALTYKILCIADERVTMERIAARESWSLEDAIKYSTQRTQGLNQKFDRLYGVSDPYQPDWFDLVIDTTDLSAGKVLDFALKNFLESQKDGHDLAHVLEVD